MEPSLGLKRIMLGSVVLPVVVALSGCRRSMDVPSWTSVPEPVAASRQDADATPSPDLRTDMTGHAAAESDAPGQTETEPEGDAVAADREEVQPATVAQAAEFEDLYDGPVYTARLTGSEDCLGLCEDQHELAAQLALRVLVLPREVDEDKLALYPVFRRRP